MMAVLWLKTILVILPPYVLRWHGDLARTNSQPLADRPRLWSGPPLAQPAGCLLVCGADERGSDGVSPAMFAVGAICAAASGLLPHRVASGAAQRTTAGARRPVWLVLRHPGLLTPACLAVLAADSAAIQPVESRLRC